MRMFQLMIFAVLGAMAYTTPALAQRHSETVECRSDDYRLARCRVDWNDVRLVRQLSSSACVEGRSWGTDRRGIWVDKGCAAVFAEAGRGHGGRPDHGDWRPGAGWDQDIRFRCESNDYRYNMCQVDIGRGGRVYIERQISDSRCVEGRSWGSNRAGVWVSDGCAAIFVVERRWR